MLTLAPLFLIGGLVISRSRLTIQADVEQVWKASAARSEAAAERAAGRSKLLLVRQLEVSYGNVQVLFGVDLEVDEGEVVALLGTNGAGKSTLLNAICGITEAERGAVIYDGRDITHAPPNEIAALGISQVPGGKAVFPSLSVTENLELASWLQRDQREMKASISRVHEIFPILAARKQRRPQASPAERQLRAHPSRAACRHLRRSRHPPGTAQRVRRARHLAGNRRQSGVPVSVGDREPRACIVAAARPA